MNSPFFSSPTKKKEERYRKTRRKHKITGRERRLVQDEKIVGQKMERTMG